MWIKTMTGHEEELRPEFLQINIGRVSALCGRLCMIHSWYIKSLRFREIFIHKVKNQAVSLRPSGSTAPKTEMWWFCGRNQFLKNTSVNAAHHCVLQFHLNLCEGKTETRPRDKHCREIQFGNREHRVLRAKEERNLSAGDSVKVNLILRKPQQSDDSYEHTLWWQWEGKTPF